MTDAHIEGHGLVMHDGDGLKGLLWTEAGDGIRLSAVRGGEEALNVVLEWAAFKTFIESSFQWMVELEVERADPPRRSPNPRSRRVREKRRGH